MLRMLWGVLLTSLSLVACRERASQQSPAQATESQQSSRSRTFEDLDGFYFLRDTVSILGYKIIALGLAPRVALIKEDSTGHQDTSPDCAEVLVSSDTVHLRCELPPIGVVTIDGKFLVPRVANGVVVTVGPGQSVDDVDELSAILTVTRNNARIHSARHNFTFQLGE
jgi:hypothetical protein